MPTLTSLCTPTVVDAVVAVSHLESIVGVVGRPARVDQLGGVVVSRTSATKALFDRVSQTDSFQSKYTYLVAATWDRRLMTLFRPPNISQLAQTSLVM